MSGQREKYIQVKLATKNMNPLEHSESIWTEKHCLPWINGGFLFSFFLRSSISDIMFTTIVYLVFAVGVISVESGLHGEDGSAYETVAKCIQTGWNAVGTDMRVKGRHTEMPEKLEQLCIYFRVRLFHV